MSICTDLSLIKNGFVLSYAPFLLFLCFSLFWYTDQVCSSHSHLHSILQVPSSNPGPPIDISNRVFMFCLSIPTPIPV